MALELHFELLLNRRVYDRDGNAVGHLEEIRATRDGVVIEYHVGAFALFERLGAWSLGRAILRALRLSRKGGGYRVPWDQLDLTQPSRLRLRCAVEALRRLDAA